MSNTIEAVATIKKRIRAVAKEHAPHEHFGSPLNICRICGEKYTYIQKPYELLRANKT